VEIRTLKLITGEEVIAEIVSYDDSYLAVRNPHTLAQTPDGKMAFMPWHPVSHDAMDNTDRTRSFKQTHIMDEAEPLDNIKKMYEQVFGVGLVVPDKKIVTE